MTHPDGFPKHNVLNKWTHDITIGIGWPAYQINQTYDLSALPPPTFTPEEIKENTLIQQQVEKLIPDLEKLTGLRVRFISPNDKAERTEHFARIRIVPSRIGVMSTPDGLRWTNFKKVRYNGGLTFTSMWSFKPYLRKLPGAVSFTPYATAEVDGYLLPDPDNSMGMAVCNVNTYLSEGLTRSMVTECLARAIGIPEAVKSRNDVVLGKWNLAYAKLAENFATHQKRNSTKNLSYLEPAQLEEYNKKVTAYDKFQPYDRAMISLLYCRNLKPQMDKFQAIEGLLGSDTCFRRLGNED